MARRSLAIACALVVLAFGCGESEVEPETVVVSGSASCREVATVGDERNRYACEEVVDDERVSGSSIAIRASRL